MWTCQFCLQFFAFCNWHLAPQKFAKIEADSDAIDSNKVGDVLDVVDVTIKRRFFFVRANKNGIYADYAATGADHFDLVIADVSFHVIETPHVCVRNDDGPVRQRANFFEPGCVDVGEIEQNAKAITLGDELATERG